MSSWKEPTFIWANAVVVGSSSGIGIVVSIDVEEFIIMALEWGKDDGWDIETYYKDHPEHRMSFGRDVYEEYIDGLRVSTSVDFS